MRTIDVVVRIIGVPTEEAIDNIADVIHRVVSDGAMASDIWYNGAAFNVIDVQEVE